MAPALVDTQPPQDIKPAQPGTVGYKEAFAYGGPKAFKKDQELHGTATQPPASFPKYLPTWTDKTYPPLEPFEHHDHGKDADPTFPDLFGEGAEVDDLTGNIGAEVNGVQLSKLNDKGKDQLALFVAQKKVVAFRNQDLANLDIADAIEFGGYFGRHHIHPASGAPEGHPEVHLVHRGADDTTAASYFKDRTNSSTWHTDVSYEQQPPGTTFLYVLDGPKAGGDTLFANMAEAYRRLSPEFQKRLHGLQAVHSAVEQANASRDRGGVVRREPVTNVHPVVRTHPATGEKAIYVNSQFTRKIVGFKKEESDMLLKFLYDHTALSQDFS